MNCDVAVVGAGPAGLTVARICADAGYSVTICEEHETVGHPSHCTGKLSTNALHELGIKAEGKLTEVAGAQFISPHFRSFSITRARTQAIIIDRTRFDQYLSDIAVDAGALLLTNTRVHDVTVDPAIARLKCRGISGNLSIRSRIVVGADGPHSIVAKPCSLSMKRDAMRLGAQREIQNVPTNPGMVEVFLGRTWAPGFFAWLVPTGAMSARIGLALPLHAAPDTLTYLDNFMKHHPLIRDRLKSGRCVHQSVHIIPTGGPPNQTVSDGVLLLGDAAGQVKSTTGGGIYFGMRCAHIAGEVITAALGNAQGVLTQSSLKPYEERWRAGVGQEIEFSVHMRRFLDSLTDEEVNYLFDVLAQNEALLKTIEMTGDIDRQSIVSRSSLRYLVKVIKKPRLLMKMSRLLTRFALK